MFDGETEGVVPGRGTKMCFVVQFECGQGGCLTERQRELFQAEGPKTEKEREPSVESLEHGILRVESI